MKVITIRRLDLQFDGDVVTKGTAIKQAKQYLDIVNEKLMVMDGNPQLFAHEDEVEIEETEDEEEEG